MPINRNPRSTTASYPPAIDPRNSFFRFHSFARETSTRPRKEDLSSHHGSTTRTHETRTNDEPGVGKPIPIDPDPHAFIRSLNASHHNCGYVPVVRRRRRRSLQRGRASALSRYRSRRNHRLRPSRRLRHHDGIALARVSVASVSRRSVASIARARAVFVAETPSCSFSESLFVVLYVQKYIGFIYGYIRRYYMYCNIK